MELRIINLSFVFGEYNLFLSAIVFIFVSYYVCPYNSDEKWENSMRPITIRLT
jgi:hypothetical protein